jgi:hypothetical protein
MTCSTIEGSSSSQPSTVPAGRDVNPKIRCGTYPTRALTSRAGTNGGGIFNYGGTLNGAVDGRNVYNNTPDNIAP